MRPKHYTYYILTTLIAGLGLTTAFAATETPVSEEVPAADLKQLTDPSILTRRIWLETEWNKFEDGSHVVEETLGAFWSWRIGANQDWAVRLKLPVKGRFGGDLPDIGSIGDIKIATGTAVRVSNNFRIGGGLDLQFPTARRELSDNAWRLQELLVLAWDITPWLTFSPSWEYNQSLDEENGAADIHFLESFFPFTFILPDKWAFAVGYENKVDFEDDSEWTHRAKVLIAKELDNVPLSFALSAKRDFNGGPKDFQVNFVITWFFRPKTLPPPAPSSQ